MAWDMMGGEMGGESHLGTRKRSMMDSEALAEIAAETPSVETLVYESPPPPTPSSGCGSLHGSSLFSPRDFTWKAWMGDAWEMRGRCVGDAWEMRRTCAGDAGGCDGRGRKRGLSKGLSDGLPHGLPNIPGALPP